MPDRIRSFRTWLGESWSTPVILLGIFLVALYLRAYFPWALAWPDGLLSGGSDSYYHRRIIEHILQTGKELTWDPMLNFPLGLTNPRPPIYQWTTAVPGIVLSPLFGDVWQSVKFTFLIGTAFWGALTIFPLYFLTKEAFGRRAALLAAFFLAVLPAHLQRSPATDADHDAIVLFFIVAAFFFFLKSLRVLDERRWVENWAFWTKEGRTSVVAGLRGFFAENRATVLYAMLAGWSIAAVALTWQGWAYAPTVVLLYFLFQILVHRFRNQDLMGVTIAYVIAIGLPLLVAFPWYWANNQVKVWFDVPFYLFLASVGLAVIFTVTRDYPWALVVPAVLGSGAIALAILAIFYPAIIIVLLSGAGYFVRSKAYETIAEAQPPGLSQIILSFGAATYFLALFGVLWMAYTITKRRSPDYLFVVAWIVVAIFAAQSAARFIFNASPAFAIASAATMVLILDWLRFDEMRKTFRSLGGRRVSAFRRSVKVRHVFGSLLVIAILIPSVWYGVDAAIPYEEKSQYDQQVYYAFPDFWKPPGYESQASGGSSFFFGAFGYSLPLTKEYFPAAWAWFANQDANVTPEWRKPAYLSWWDYGFEASNAGRHPTVADNFLDGYQLAGQFLTAQSENDAIALLDLRLLQGDWAANGRHFSTGTRATLAALGVPYGPLEDAFNNPDKYVAIVNADPVTYGDWETLQSLNAQYIYGRVFLTSRLDDNGLVELNHALRERTGASIRYFGVDTRLFPLDGQNTGIFYAPAKLSDHRILQLPDGRAIPTDFFDITATASGRGTNISLTDIRPTDEVTALAIRFKDGFYNSMFYRAYVGFSPKVAGQNCDDCIPGIQSSTNSQIGNINPMQAWNLSHFKLVYKTAYYNPYPPEQVANHTDAWTAIDYAAAQDLQGAINRGEATGVVDSTPAAVIRRGVVFVKYYDGAFLNGTARLSGVPWPGVRVTAQDEYGVPHDSAVTDANGRYSLLLPFGDVTVSASVGTPDNLTMVSPTVVSQATFSVSDAAAMRENVDANADGAFDWLLTGNIDVAGETLAGVLFIDSDKNGEFDSGEPVLAGANLTFAGPSVDLTRHVRTDESGRFSAEALYPGNYAAAATWQGRTLDLGNVSIGRDQGPKDLPITPLSVQGYVLDTQARPVGNATVVLTDLTNETTRRTVALPTGLYTFPAVLLGDFRLSASRGSQYSIPERTSFAATTNLTYTNITVYPSATVSLRTTIGGAPAAFVTAEFTQRSALASTLIATTDAVGKATTVLPAGTWDVHARHYRDGSLYAAVGGLTAVAGGTPSFTVDLALGAVVTGTVFDASNRTSTLNIAEVLFRNPLGEYRATTDANGRFFTFLPQGTWSIQVSHLDQTLLTTRVIAGNVDLALGVGRGIAISGSVFREFPGNVSVQIEDPVPDTVVTFSNATQSFEAIAGPQGRFSIALPSTGRYALSLRRDGYVPYDAPARTVFDWQADATFHLLAENVSVSGALTLGGAPFTDATLPVQFLAEGPGAITAQANLDGSGGYQLSLAPGRYKVVVDRDVSGNGDVRLQLRAPTDISLAVGETARVEDLALATRVQVSGTVTLRGQPSSPIVVFSGPDAVRVNATDGSFATFLATGDYTISANLTEGATAYLALQPLAVQSPSNVTLTLSRATNVSGTALYNGNSIAGLPVTFTRADGGVARATTDAAGYHVLLLGGAWAVQVDHVAPATEGTATRSVRYTFSGSVTVIQDTPVQLFTLDLTRSLSNTTVTGTARYRDTGVIAQIAFTAHGSDGINATAAAGSDGTYNVGLQPGTYDVYAFDGLDQAAFLGSFNVTAGEPRTFDLPLVPAFPVTGVTTYRANVLVAANVTFTSSAGAVRTTSSASGSYRVFLPAASYTVEAVTTGTENEVSITYRTTATVSLPEPTLNLPLEKVVQRGIGITWDATQRETISAGGSAEYTVVVTNLGNDDDTISLSASAAGFSLDFQPDVVSLGFGTARKTHEVGVTITAAEDALVAHAPISINAESSDGSTKNSVVVNVTVRQFRGLAATVASDAPIWDGQYLNYRLEVQNKGNDAVTYRLTIPNLGELAAIGWRANLVAPTGGDLASSLDLTVPANSTSKPVLRLEKNGGMSGALARIDVADKTDAQSSATITVQLQMPILRVEGSVGASGSGISSKGPGLDLASMAFLISIVAMIAAAAYLVILRRRSR